LKTAGQKTYSTRGGFGSTGQHFQNTNIINLTQQRIQFKTEEIIKDKNQFLKIEEYLGPRKITIKNINIRLLSTPINRAHQTFELQKFENTLIKKASPLLLSRIPTIQLSHLHQEQELIQEKPSTRKLTEPNITEKEILTLLAADLSINKQLTIDGFQYFQNMDPIIKAIKENLVGKHTMPAYSLKKGKVCKICTETDSQEPRLAIYIPTFLLIPTVIYMHSRVQ
jgi:hypothetical protein